MPQIYLAIGANLGDRLASLKQAVEHLKPYVEITALSAVYETAAAYVTDQPRFLNAAIGGTTELDPLPLLYAIKAIERDIGRTPTFRYGPRVIDIDILYYDTEQVHQVDLVVPHPRIAERSFVLSPLADIAPDFIDPVTHKTISAMLESLPSTQDVVKSDFSL